MNKTIRYFMFGLIGLIMLVATAMSALAIPSINLISPANNTIFSFSNTNVSVMLNATITNTNANTMCLNIFGDNSAIPAMESLLFRQCGLANNTNRAYNLTSPIINSAYANTTGLILSYHFDNQTQYGETSTNIYDFSGHNKNASLVGNATINTIDYKFGYSAKSSDIGQSCIVSNNNINLTESFSISLWYYVQYNNLVPANSLISQRNGTATIGTRNWYIIIDTAASNYSWKVGDTNGNSFFSTYPDVTYGNWTHIVFVRNATNSSWYRNGILEQSGVGGSILTGNMPLFMGCRGNGTGGYQYNWNISFDEIGAWNRTLSASEAMDLYRLKNGTYRWYVNVSDVSNSANSDVRTFYLNEPTKPTSCFNALLANTAYDIQNNMSGSCINIRANNVTINGNGYTVTGNINGSGNGTSLNSFTNLTVNNIILRGNILLDAGYDGLGDGGKGGKITLINSLIGNISSLGGDCSEDSTAGDGGEAVITNSSVVDINIYGHNANGGAGPGGKGGIVTANYSIISIIDAHGGEGTGGSAPGNDGGIVKLTNSTITTINVRGGDDQGGGGGFGNGGNVTIITSNLNLTDISIDIYSGGTIGKLIINQTSFYNNYGSIRFGYITTSNTNFNSIMSISNNYAFVNSTSYISYNVSAIINLKNIPTNFTNPGIFRNLNQLCNSTTNPSCYNLTSLNIGNVSFNVSGWTSYNIGEVPDTTKPTYSNLIISPISGVIYFPGQIYKFNSTWTDNVAVDKVLMEFNGINYTTLNYTGSVYNFSISNLAVGNYNYIWYANDTSNNKNNTGIQTYTINKANPTCSLSFNQVSPIIYGTQLNASCSCSNTETSTVLLRNGTDVTSTENNKLVTLAVNSYIYNCTSSQSQNYTSASNTSVFSINQAPSSLNLVLNGQDSNISANQNQNITINATLVTGLGYIELYRDGLLINNGTSPRNNITSFNVIGIHNITIQYPGNQNYTSGVYTHFIQINNNTPPIIINVTNTSITTSSTLIIWINDKNSNATINYGITPAFGGVSSNSSFISNWSITLNNLLQNTQYFYNITSCDIYGDCTTSGIYNFTTLIIPPIPPSGSGGGTSTGNDYNFSLDIDIPPTILQGDDFLINVKVKNSNGASININSMLFTIIDGKNNVLFNEYVYNSSIGIYTASYHVPSNALTGTYYFRVQAYNGFHYINNIIAFNVITKTQTTEYFWYKFTIYWHNFIEWIENLWNLIWNGVVANNHL